MTVHHGRYSWWWPAGPHAAEQPIGVAEHSEPARGKRRPVPCSPFQCSDRSPGRWCRCRRYVDALPADSRQFRCGQTASAGRHDAAAAEICCYAEPWAAASASVANPSSSSTSAVSAPSCGAGPATRPDVRENHVGTPGKRTGPCSVLSVSKKPAALRCGSSNSASGVRSGAAGISSSRNSASHSVVRSKPR